MCVTLVWSLDKCNKTPALDAKEGGDKNPRSVSQFCKPSARSGTVHRYILSGTVPTYIIHEMNYAATLPSLAGFADTGSDGPHLARMYGICTYVSVLSSTAIPRKDRLADHQLG